MLTTLGLFSFTKRTRHWIYWDVHALIQCKIASVLLRRKIQSEKFNDFVQTQFSFPLKHLKTDVNYVEKQSTLDRLNNLSRWPGGKARLHTILLWNSTEEILGQLHVSSIRICRQRQINDKHAADQQAKRKNGPWRWSHGPYLLHHHRTTIGSQIAESDHLLNCWISNYAIDRSVNMKSVSFEDKTEKHQFVV